MESLTVIRRCLRAIEDGTFAGIADLYTPEMMIEQLPNRIYPQGIRSDLAQMSEGFATYATKASVLFISFSSDNVERQVYSTGDPQLLKYPD